MASDAGLDDGTGEHGDAGDEAGVGDHRANGLPGDRGEGGEGGRCAAERPGRPGGDGEQEVSATGRGWDEWCSVPVRLRGVGRSWWCGRGPDQRGEHEDHHQVQGQTGGVRPGQPLGDRAGDQGSDAETGRGGDRGAPGGGTCAVLRRGDLLEPGRPGGQHESDGGSGEHPTGDEDEGADRFGEEVRGEGDEGADDREDQGRTHHSAAPPSVGSGTADEQGGDQADDVDGEEEVYLCLAEVVDLAHDREQRGEEVRAEADGEHAQGDAEPRGDGGAACGSGAGCLCASGRTGVGVVIPW